MTEVIGGREAYPIEMVMAKQPTVYRFYDSSRRLLYIGVTASRVFERLLWHSHAREWWPEVAFVTFEPCATAELAAAAEYSAIREEGAAYNSLLQGRLPVRAIPDPYYVAKILSRKARARRWSMRDLAAQAGVDMEAMPTSERPPTAPIMRRLLRALDLRARDFRALVEEREAFEKEMATHPAEAGA